MSLPSWVKDRIDNLDKYKADNADVLTAMSGLIDALESLGIIDVRRGRPTNDRCDNPWIDTNVPVVGDTLKSIWIRRAQG